MTNGQLDPYLSALNEHRYEPSLYEPPEVYSKPNRVKKESVHCVYCKNKVKGKPFFGPRNGEPYCNEKCAKRHQEWFEGRENPRAYWG